MSSEQTPLLGSRAIRTEGALAQLASPTTRILLAGFLISVALSFTQVPILYAFRVMECDQFYKDHPPMAGGIGEAEDRCARSEIDGGTAAQVSVLGLSTTFCGVLNLFVAGWQIKRLGPRAALALQTAAPAARVAVQAAAVGVGARAGIVAMQASQLINVLGGPAGYLLALNTAVGAATAAAQRTAVFGQLQGSVMLGTALGYLLGGSVGDAWGLEKPFAVACALFVASSAYVAVVVPHIDLEEEERAKGQKKASTLEAVFGALRVLRPQRLRTEQGTVIRHRGIQLLALGVFLGVLATGYAPLLILMYATAAFGFRPTENGYLMSVNAVIRGVFLLFLFPRIIQRGRAWYARAEGAVAGSPPSATLPVVPPAAGLLAGNEPTPATPGRGFDLAFLRWSLVADGLVTAYTACATERWHVYLAGFLLPLASGSAPASKGVIAEMCTGGGRQADALQVMTLVENVAMLSTLGLFGFLFAAFSTMGQAHLTFYCNAAVALVAVLVLAFAHFPEGSEEEL